MRILFDQGVPVPLRRYLHPHSVDTAAERGWAKLKNGDLLSHVESNGYELFVTTDKNLQYQQNLSSRAIGILVLSTTSWPRIQKCADALRIKIDSFDLGKYEEFIIQ